MRRRHREMSDERLHDRLAILHFERQRFAGVTIGSMTDCVAMQRGCDPVGIPNAIRVILFTVRSNWK